MVKNILVPLDIAPVHTAIIDMAVDLARAFDARLWLLHVAAPDPDFVGYEAGPVHVRDQRAAELRSEHLWLQQLRDTLVQQGLVAEALLVQGPTAETVLEEAERLDCDLILMGSSGRRGLARAMQGSLPDLVLRANRAAVLVVPLHAS